MKSPEGLALNESREDIEIVREEMRAALLVEACGFDETQGACEKRWSDEYSPTFDKLFDEFVEQNREHEDILQLWVENRGPIVGVFHEKLNDLDIKSDLAA